jgi:hypothetical protein
MPRRSARAAWHDVPVRASERAVVSPTVWLLWLVAAFIGSLELAWWFLWHVLPA